MNTSESREDVLRVWGWLFLVAGFIGLIILIALAQPDEYSYGADKKLNVSYIVIGIIGAINGLVIKLILGGLAELIRVSRIGKNAAQDIPQINCPACAEEIKTEAKMCCHCRYVVAKHVWALPVKNDGNANCPLCKSVISPGENQFELGRMNCPSCKQTIHIKKGETVKSNVAEWT